MHQLDPYIGVLSGMRNMRINMIEIYGSIAVYAQMGLLDSHPQTAFKVKFPPVDIVAYWRKPQPNHQGGLIGNPITLN